jgi:hypothetical protein
MVGTLNRSVRKRLLMTSSLLIYEADQAHANATTERVKEKNRSSEGVLA